MTAPTAPHVRIVEFGEYRYAVEAELLGAHHEPALISLLAINGQRISDALGTSTHLAD